VLQLVRTFFCLKLFQKNWGWKFSIWGDLGATLKFDHNTSSVGTLKLSARKLEVFASLPHF